MSLNTEFIDEFKRLDDICKQMYGNSRDGKLGVTAYLSEMYDRSNDARQYGIPDWGSDLYFLKRVRNMRNDLIHGKVSLSSSYCTEDDVLFVIEMHNRILDGTDPLCLLNDAMYPRKKVSYSAPSSNVGCMTLAAVLVTLTVTAICLIACIV